MIRLSNSIKSTDIHQNNSNDNHNNTCIGIDLMWVDSKYRRQGIAQRLCDAVRRYFAYGLVVTKQQLCFSQPTQAGHAFAIKYSGSIVDKENEKCFWAYS